MHPPTEHQAVAWSAETMRELMADWVNAFPTSADAQAAYASALESVSAIKGTSADLAAALEYARRSAAHTDSADLRVYRRVAVVRLLLKSDSIAAARALADSLIAGTPNPTPFQAGYLGNLAALLGRARLAASLLRIAAADSDHVPFLDASGRRLSLPSELMSTILALRAYASVGGPRDSVRATYDRVNRLLDRTVPAGGRPAIRGRVLSTPVVLTVDDLGARQLAESSPGDPLLAMRVAVASGDQRAARTAGDRFIAQGEAYSTGTVGIDRWTAYATMMLALGDSAAAMRTLDAALDALPRARSILLEATPQAATIGRAMLLRAQLAAKAGDRSTALRRMREADALWGRADAELRAPLEALRRQL
jgi:hypothetical protein